MSYHLPLAQAQTNSTSKNSPVPYLSTTPNGSASAKANVTSKSTPRSVGPSVDALLTQGRQLLKIGQPKAAVGTLTNYLRARPNDPNGHFYLGLALDEAGVPAQAIWSYSKALELANHEGMDSLELRVNIANTLVKLNQLDDAIFNYRRALEINPKCAQAHLNLGRVLITKHRPQDAFAELNHAADLGINEPSLFYYRALALKALHRDSDASRQLNLFLQWLPEKDGAKSLHQQALQSFEEMGTNPTSAH